MSAPDILSTPNSGALQPRKLARGALLVVKPLAKLINVPGVQEFVHNAQELIVALKPWILQAPGVNDTNARGVVSQIVEIATVVGSAMEQFGAADADVATACTQKLRPFTEYLENMKAEIDHYQQLPYATKLALHNSMAVTLAQHDSELRLRTILLCLDQSLVTVHTLAQVQRAITQLQAQVTAIGSNSATNSNVTTSQAEVAELCVWLSRWSGCMDISGNDSLPFFFRHARSLVWHLTGEDNET